MELPEIEERHVEGFDGTDIAYQVVGEGPALLLCNGLGGSWMAWSHQIAYLSDRYRLISWDYRGLYGSAAPRDREALGVVESARDAEAVLDAEGVDRAAFVGWSMGVQVALEAFRRSAARVAALVLINGVSGHPFETLPAAGLVSPLMPPLVRTLGIYPELAEAVVRRAGDLPEVARWLKRAGLLSKGLDEELFEELVRSFSRLDMCSFLRTLELPGEHDATDMLGEIDVPTLVLAGERDLLTPPSAAERMAGRVPGAELTVVPGGTHYVAVEYPELVNLRLEKFFCERGFGPEAR